MSDMRLDIDADRLEAVLRIPAGCEPALDAVRALVVDAGIRFGLLKDALTRLCPSAEEQMVVIARGRPPESARQRHFELDAARTGGDVAVSAGQIVGRIRPPRPERPGMGVDGAPVPPAAAASDTPEPLIGPGLHVQGDLVICDREGWLVQEDDGLIYVGLTHCPCARVSEPQLVVSADALTCELALAPGEFVLPQDLKQAVGAAGITFGLLGERLGQAGQPSREARTLVLARGVPAERGEDAWIEPLIDDQLHFTVNEDGSMDFRDAHKVKEVTVGRPLARCHHNGAGQDGMTILGETIPAEAGSSIDYAGFVGEGVGFSQEDPMVMEALRDGVFVRELRGVIKVLDVVVIDGDVDMSTGNVDSRFPVVITGDVKAGFQVKSSSDITVRGVIEDARVSAQGSLTVTRGILPGKQRVKAHADIVALYVSGRTVKARNLFVGQEIRHGHIECTGMLQARGIIGGEVQVADHIAAASLGTDNEEPTEIRVGYDPYQRRLLAEAQERRRSLAAEMEEMTNEHQDLQARFKEVTNRLRMLQASRTRQPEGIQRYKDKAHELLEASRAVAAKVKEFKREFEAVEAQADELNEAALSLQRKAWIEVGGIAHPRVHLVFGDDVGLMVRQPTSNPVYRLIEGEVRA
ncbi:MAG: FapA family protein [Planctomycetota bacterium]